MKKKTVVYRIVNQVTEKCYVGSSWRLSKRWQRHMGDLKNGIHHSHAMQRDYDTLGKASFVHEILEEFDEPADARNRESHWIARFDSHLNGYNTSSNGLYGTPSAVDRAALNAYLKQIWNTEEKREYARLRAKRQFSKKENRVAASEKQKDFIKNNPERAFEISSAGGRAGAKKARETVRKEIFRSDGKKYLAVIDAARDMSKSPATDDVERARACIKQALKHKNKSLGFHWNYLKNKELTQNGD